MSDELISDIERSQIEGLSAWEILVRKVGYDRALQTLAEAIRPNFVNISETAWKNHFPFSPDVFEFSYGDGRWGTCGFVKIGGVFADKVPVRVCLDRGWKDLDLEEPTFS